jgi:hypothetical protein
MKKLNDQFAVTQLVKGTELHIHSFTPGVAHTVVHGPLPIFLNKILLKHSQSMCSHVIYGCFQATRTGLSRYDGDHMAWETENTYS